MRSLFCVYEMIFIESKEFGQEVYFRTDRGTVDSRIPNRYWFELPQNWSIQRKNDPVIGISEIYFNQCIRAIRYRVTLELLDSVEHDPIEAYTISVYDYCFMSRGHTFQKFITEFIRNWDAAIVTKNAELATCAGYELTPYVKHDLFVEQCYEERGSETITVIKFDTTRTEKPDRWTTVVSPFNGNLIEVVPQITVEMLSDDAKEVLNGTKTVAQIDALDDNDEEVPNNNIVSMITRQNILHLYPLWDRSNVYITSNISSMTDGGFLGYSRSEPLTRMKFYRLDNKIQKFWIEIYSSRDNRVRTVFPKDGMDYLAIESVVYFDASKALK